MELITKEDFNRVLASDIYYKDRWEYISEVIKFAREVAPKRVLEIGPYKLPIFKDSETMDIVKNYPGLTYLADATDLPYQFEGKSFDLLVAMQCLEHLHPMQREVFSEWRRIAKTIVVSLPYMWHCPEDVMHHNIGLDTIKQWTGIDPTKTSIKAARVILRYDQ